MISGIKILWLSILLICLPVMVVARQQNPLDKRAATDSLSGIEVRLEQVASGKTMTTKTDEKGSFSFSNVEAGVYKLRIGCVTAERGDKKGCSAEFNIKISDKSTGNITGSVQKSSDRK
jgi:hypothetical protein